MSELQNQFDALVEAIAAYNTGNKMGRAAAILRFQFVADAALEALTEALLDKQAVCRNRRELISQGHTHGLIKNEKTWLKLIFDREHLDEAWDDCIAEVIYENITELYLDVLSDFIAKIEIG